MIIAPAHTVVELLRFTPESGRTAAFFAALERAARAAGVDLHTTRHYRGGASWLIVWGPGAPDRVDPMAQQLAAGGHVIAVDLAYWQRDHKLRLSIDAAHPQRWVMQGDWPATRAQADRVLPVAASAWLPNGPVIVAGIGRKAHVQYGRAARLWEARMIDEARAHGRVVRYRPKKDGDVPSGVAHAGAGPIETVLRGASLVITWHSNVAIDAIRLGIPVICQDGAAAAVCPSEWYDAPRPLDPAVRDRFLANLAWFQWLNSEAFQCWRWLRALVEVR